MRLVGWGGEREEEERRVPGGERGTVSVRRRAVRCVDLVFVPCVGAGFVVGK